MHSGAVNSNDSKDQPPASTYTLSCRCSELLFLKQDDIKPYSSLLRTIEGRQSPARPKGNDYGFLDGLKPLLRRPSKPERECPHLRALGPPLSRSSRRASLRPGTALGASLSLSALLAMSFAVCCASLSAPLAPLGGRLSFASAAF